MADDIFDIIIDKANDSKLLCLIYAQIIDHNIQMNQQCPNSWSALLSLQRCLKKQFLLVEKEQQEKIKLKRQIEESIRSYHTLSIESTCRHGELLKDEGFDNCYNFIKDVILTISTNLAIGKEILYTCQERSTLVGLVVNGFYQNIESSDPWGKDITRLMHTLLSDLFEAKTQKNNEHFGKLERIIEAWMLYMSKAEHEHYFQQIADQTLRELLQQDVHVRSSRNQEQLQQQAINLNSTHSPTIVYRWQVKDKQQLLGQFLHKIEVQAQLCPPSIKMPLRAVTSAKDVVSDKGLLSRVWLLINCFYLRPFINVSKISGLEPQIKERILGFVDSLISRWGFSAELAKGLNCKINQANEGQIHKVCLNLISLNEDRYTTSISNQNNSSEIQIKIYGVYLNLVQLHELLILFNSNRQVFSKISEKITSRTSKIFEISPSLQFLKREKPSLLFVSLGQLRYEQSISSDYYKNYTNVYRSETIKQMLKQVLVQLESLSDYRTDSRRTFVEIFQGIIDRNKEGKSKSSLTAQLEMKVKFLIFLLAKNGETEKHEQKIVEEMNHQLVQRNIINVKLFQDTKFSLLKVYCNLRNLKNQIKAKREAQRRSLAKMNLLGKIESLRFNLCLTSRSSRNKSTGQELFDKYKYRISSADQILMLSTKQCIHSENMFTGRENHANNVAVFLQVFANLPEVKYLINNPAFLAEEGEPSLFIYCNAAKIGQAFHCFLKEVIDRLKVQHDEKSMLQSILYRYLNQILLGRNEGPYSGLKDRLLLDRIEELSNRKLCSSPKKNQSRKRRGSHSETDLNASSSKMEAQLKEDYSKIAATKIQFEQLIEIGSRHISALGNVSGPLEKMRKLKELLDIYRIVLGHTKSDAKSLEQTEQLLVNSIIAAKPKNMISTLSYMEMFIPEEKLISIEGKILNLFQKATKTILRGVGSIRDKSRILEC